MQDQEKIPPFVIFFILLSSSFAVYATIVCFTTLIDNSWRYSFWEHPYAASRECCHNCLSSLWLSLLTILLAPAVIVTIVYEMTLKPLVKLATTLVYLGVDDTTDTASTSITSSLSNDSYGTCDLNSLSNPAISV